MLAGHLSGALYCQADFVKSLAEGFEFSGSFSYSSSYPSAPNPCITIDDFGPLGLPLNPREAKHLINVCTQAPFGKNERTIVDKSVRDTWELDPTKVRTSSLYLSLVMYNSSQNTVQVHFNNSEWTAWLNGKVVPAVRAGLGVTSTNVDARLYKLLLYETGSHFMAHQEYA